MQVFNNKQFEVNATFSFYLILFVVKQYLKYYYTRIHQEIDI